MGTGKVYRQGGAPKRTAMKPSLRCYSLLLILSCEGTWWPSASQMDCGISTTEDRGTLIFVGPVAPSMFLAHCRCSVNITQWKELGLWRRQSEQAFSAQLCLF